MSDLTRHHIDTPIGPLTIELSGGAMTMLDFGALGEAAPGPRSRGLAAEIRRQIEAYFAGNFTGITTELNAGMQPEEARQLDVLNRKLEDSNRHITRLQR